MSEVSPQTFVLPNGLRVIHQHSPSEISYCGFAINAGTRDEEADEHGLAHFMEHLLFKGTRKRKAHHIAARMENVGGELNAYTTKEETFVYSVFLHEYTERAVELLFDLVFRSDFPPAQIERERDVILDEIAIYNDSPSELIYDDFENLLFRGNEPGHYILGTPQSLERLGRDNFVRFAARQYHPSQMVFFYFGKTPPEKILRLSERHAPEKSSAFVAKARKTPNGIAPRQEIVPKGNAQTHVLVGNRGYSLFHPNRHALYLLSNLLGGEGMNSRLNLSLREKHGLVYNVESTTAFYSDCGVFGVYLGCDAKNTEKCLRLVKKEFNRIIDTPLTPQQLAVAKRQLKGQIGISAENRESVALGMAKSLLHTNDYNSIEQTFATIDAVSSAQIQAVASEVLLPRALSEIRYI
ncbi:MAG: insulinase family protein [Dysgonamonadaceae bacterium]|jgi:predicted Zn-dependent peptidase|nr:insulinase family protein [Dysgonamonadaceae bacterium]